MTLPKIAAVQMNSAGDVKQNLNAARKHIAHAAESGASLVVLPEMFICMGEPLGQWVHYAEPFGEGPIQLALSDAAKEHQIWIVGGTLPILGESSDKAYASCLVFDDTGTCVARYDKMHLFDVIVEPGVESYQESLFTLPGDHITYLDSPFGRIGLAVCYDLRFPGLFMQLAEAKCDIIIVPSAFTAKTGIAHFETLVRARALDTLAYVITANQTGTHSGNRKTFGHSMIVGPWGNILQSMRDQTGYIISAIDHELIKNTRQRFPLQMHNKFDAKLDNS